MSLHTKDPGIPINKENAKKNVKVATLETSRPIVITRRPALKELGNNLPVQQQTFGKKPACGAAIVTKKPVLVTKTSNHLTKKETVPKILTRLPAIREDKVSNRESESYSTKQLGDIFNVDTSDDPFLVSEYVQDIYLYLQELETKYSIDVHFLQLHPTTPKMRSIVMNWLVEVHVNFKCLLETLHLSVAIVDRYLQINRSVGRETLQLVGASAMLVAAKYEEIYTPDVSDFVYVCDNAFTKKQILSMSMDILKKLEFNLGRPLSLHFLRRYNKLAKVKAEHHTLAKYLLELALIEYDMAHVKPSVQAAAACCLSIGILDRLSDPLHAWTPVLTHFSSYKYADIKLTVVNLACTLGRADSAKTQAVRTKYSGSAYNKIGLNPKLNCKLVRKLISNSPLLKK